MAKKKTNVVVADKKATKASKTAETASVLVVAIEATPARYHKNGAELKSKRIACRHVVGKLLADTVKNGLPGMTTYTVAQLSAIADDRLIGSLLCKGCITVNGYTPDLKVRGSDMAEVGKTARMEHAKKHVYMVKLPASRTAAKE